MPNPVIVDPEVVNEPKELAVPEFNKKEVEAISVEATKNAIASGDIPLPPGGTKLYRHDVVGDPDTYRFAIITNKGTSLTEGISGHTVIGVLGVSHNQYPAPTAFGLVLRSAGLTTVYFDVLYNSGNISQVTIVGIQITISSDTVTEL